MGDLTYSIIHNKNHNQEFNIPLSTACPKLTRLLRKNIPSYLRIAK